MANIAIYTFNSSTDTLPTFNDEFIMITEKVLTFEDPFTVSGVLDINSIDDVTVSWGDKTMDTYDSMIESTFENCYIYYYRIDSAFRIYITHYYIDNIFEVNCQSFDDLEEPIPPLYISYYTGDFTYTDVDNGDGTITRAIYSDTLPTSISFKNKTELVSVSNLKTDNITSMREMFYGCKNLTSIDVSNFNTSIVTRMDFMFYNCTKLTSLDLSNFNTSNVTDMSYMFDSCSNLSSLDLSNFNTSIVTNMSHMFRSCSKLTTIDLSNFDTSNVTRMDFMFYNCIKLTSLDLSNFNTSNVTDMSYMLSDCNKLINIKMTESNIKSISKIITAVPTRTANSMGTLKTGTTPASSVDTATANSKYWNIVDDVIAKYKFNSSTDTLPIMTLQPSSMKISFGSIYTLNVESVDGITGTFGDGESLVIVKETDTFYSARHSSTDYRIVFEYYDGDFDLFGWTARIQDLEALPSIPDITLNVPGVYEYIDADNGDGTITRTITSNSLPISISFSGKTGLVSLSHLDTNNITSMREMFYNCTNLASIDLSSFDTSNVTDMNSMFCNCTNLTSLDVSNFNTSNVTDMYYMFGVYMDDASSVYMKLTNINGIENFDTSNVVEMGHMFSDCRMLSSLDLSNFDTSKVTSMRYMFSGCHTLSSLDVSSFDTSNVTDMGYMFNNCRMIPSLDVSNFDTSNVTDMEHMFSDCYGLTSIDLSNFDTSKVTNMSYMFNAIDGNNMNLTEIIGLENFNTGKVNNMESMFGDCTKLTSLDLSSFNTSKVTRMGWLFSNCQSLTSLKINSFDTSKVTDMEDMFYNCTKLTSLDLSNFNVSNVTDMNGMFNNCTSLTSLNLSSWIFSASVSDMFSSCENLINVKMTESNINSINQIINILPTRTSDSYGTFFVSKDILNSVDNDTANSKYWNIIKAPEYSFTMSTLKYLLTKLKEKFALKSEGDLKVDKVDGKDLVTNDYTDSYVQMNQSALNNVSISSKTDTEIQLVFESNNGDNIITIPYDKYKKSALFVDCEENFDCYKDSEYSINYRYISELRSRDYLITKTFGEEENVGYIGSIENIAFPELNEYNEPSKIEWTKVMTYDDHVSYKNNDDIFVKLYNNGTASIASNSEYPLLVRIGYHRLVVEITRNGEVIKEEIGITSRHNTYSYIPNLNDTEIRMYAIDPEGTKTGITYLKPNVKPEAPIVAYTTTDTAMRPSEIIGLTNGYTSEVNGNKVSLFKNNSSDVVTYVNFYNTNSLTNVSYMASSITNMSKTYENCTNLTGSPVCGSNVTNMHRTYYNCFSLTGSPVCGPNVTNMNTAYIRCYNLKGQPVCGDKVTDMGSAYTNCHNLVGSPVCGPNVTSMYYTYGFCYNITGQPVCGPNVTYMPYAYSNCRNLTGSPVCGDKVTNMTCTYRDCHKLTGNPVCGDNVTSMWGAYYNCSNLTGAPVCGPNVTDMINAYYNCKNLHGDFYVLSSNVSNAANCFKGRDNSRRLNIWLNHFSENDTSVLTFSNSNASSSIIGSEINWNYHYDCSENEYCKYYDPVSNICLYMPYMPPAHDSGGAN